MDKIFAKTLSIVLHPLILPSIGVLILFNCGFIYEYLPFSGKRIILLIIVLTTTVLPLTFIPFYIFKKIINNIQMDSRKERIIPFFITFTLYAFCYFLLVRLNAPEIKIIVNFILAGAIAILALFGLSFKWKISAHMVGIGCLVGSLIAFSFILKVNIQYIIIAFFFLSGFLGYSRLVLKKHKPFEVYYGWGLGFIISLTVLFLL